MSTPRSYCGNLTLPAWSLRICGTALFVGLIGLSVFAPRGRAAEGAPPPLTPAELETWKVVADPALPNVLLIGDSISIGYTREVRRLLKGKANVYRPMKPDGEPANGGDTGRGLREIEGWLGDRKWDVIHFNWGLHDLCYRDRKSKAYNNLDKVNGTLTTTIEQYEKNLEQLVTRLEQTGATLIWANSTAVPEWGPGRFTGDEVRYNQTASVVIARHHLPTHDLYTQTKSYGDRYRVGHGDMHFTDEGSALLAQTVARAIEEALAAKPRAQAQPAAQ